MIDKDKCQPMVSAQGTDMNTHREKERGEQREGRREGGRDREIDRDRDWVIYFHIKPVIQIYIEKKQGGFCELR